MVSFQRLIKKKTTILFDVLAIAFLKNNSLYTNMYVDIYALNLFTENSGEHWWEQNIFSSFNKTTSILVKLSTWCFEHSGDISCSLRGNPSHTDESWEGQNTCLWIYTLWIYVISYARCQLSYMWPLIKSMAETKSEHWTKGDIRVAVSS